jgi:hypothetical protein
MIYLTIKDHRVVAMREDTILATFKDYDDYLYTMFDRPAGLAYPYGYAGEAEAVFASSTLDFPGEYTNNAETIALANQIRNADAES